MNDLGLRRFEMYVRVCVFFAAQVTIFAKESLGAQLIQQFLAAVSEIKQLTIARVSGFGSARNYARNRMIARKGLRKIMETISKCAQGIAVTAPGFDRQFRSPRNLSDTALLDSARTFAVDALKFHDLFVKFEMAPGFIDDLKSKIEALEQAIAAYEISKASHVSATAAIEAAMEKALEVLEQLDPIVNNKLAPNPLLLGQWKNARNMERAWTSKPLESDVGNTTSASGAPA
jgi:hypothetical protein